MSLSRPEIAVIGGGTGSFTLLQELKHVTPDIAAIVNMSDDGGGSGMLRDEFGVLPPGDIRQCMVAFSDTPAVRDIFTYRFDSGRYKNQSLGNMILSGMEMKHGCFEKAIEVVSEAMHISAKVVPVTTVKNTLVLKDGPELIYGEHRIGTHRIQHEDAHVELHPPAALNPRARDAIEKADLVVIAPGNHYQSILPNLAVDGMREAIEASKAKTIAIANLVSLPGHTDNWHVADYVQSYERYLGIGAIDFILYNNDLPSSDLLKKYAKEGEFPTRTHSESFSRITATAIGAPLVAKQVFVQDPNDTIIKRTLIRHDAVEVCRKLMRVFYD